MIAIFILFTCLEEGCAVSKLRDTWGRPWKHNGMSLYRGCSLRNYLRLRGFLAC